MVSVDDFLLRLLGPWPGHLLRILEPIYGVHDLLPTFAWVVVVRTKNDRTVDRVELRAAEFCFILFRMIKVLLHVVCELAPTSLFALLLQTAG